MSGPDDLKLKQKDDMKSPEGGVVTPEKLLKEMEAFGTCVLSQEGKRINRNEKTGAWYFDIKPNDDINPDGVVYRCIVPASQYRRKRVTEMGMLGKAMSFLRPREVKEKTALRKEVSVVLLERDDAHAVSDNQKKTIGNYLTKYANEGAPQGMELEMWIKDYVELDPRTKHLNVQRPFSQLVAGMTEIFILMREYSEKAVNTMSGLEKQIVDRLNALTAEAEEKGFAIDWAGFTPGVTTPGKEPHRTFIYSVDNQKVPKDVAGSFKYMESISYMFTALIRQYVDALFSRDDPSHKDIQQALGKIAGKFGYDGPQAAQNMVRDFGWEMWQTRAFHYSISLPQDNNGLVSGAAVKNEANLYARYGELLAALNFAGDMAHGVRLTVTDDSGEQVPVLSERHLLKNILPTSEPPAAISPDRTQFDVQSTVCYNGGANAFDRSGGEVTVTLDDGSRIVVGPMHSVYRPRVTTGVKTFTDFLKARQEKSRAGGDVREVPLEAPVRFEDTSPGTTPEVLRANLFRVALQNVVHQAALIAAKDGETDVFRWLENKGILSPGLKAEELYAYHDTARGLKSQMDAVRGKLDTAKLGELSTLITRVREEIARHLEGGKRVEDVPHLKRIFEDAERGIVTLRAVEEEMHSKRDEFSALKARVEKAYTDRGRDPAEAGTLFYRWYCNNPRIAAYSNMLTNKQIATILLDVFKLQGKVEYALEDGSKVGFQLDDKIKALTDEGEADINKHDESRAVLLTLLYYNHVKREAARVRTGETVEAN